MKLGYVCQFFTTEYRGPVTNLLYELSQSIDVVNYSAVDKHMQYYSGGVHDGRTERLKDRLTVRRYETSLRLGGLLFPRNLGSLLGQETPDIIQSEEYYQPASHISYRYSRARGIPFIFNHRGSSPRDRTLRERLFFAAANIKSRSLVEGSDAIICLSGAGKKTLCDVFPRAQDKVHVIPNSIDPLAYSGAFGISFRREHDIPESSPLMLCVARLHPQKRIDLIVRAFAQVKAEVKDSVLCIVGPWFTAEKRKVDSIISGMRIDDVVFTGPIPNEKIKDAYAAADVVALTSEYEPFGYCLLEAMCLSRPVVAFGIGAVPEIVADGVSGYHVPFDDTKAFAARSIALLKDRSLALRMGSEGKKRVNKLFHVRDHSRSLQKLYSSLVRK